MSSALNLQIIDTRSPGASQKIASLRQKLSPAGDIVSEAGRQKTIEVFGEPLSPQQSVERICNDVKSRGLDALLEYTAKLDDAELTGATLRVTTSELADAHANASPDFLATIQRISENILRYQEALLHQNVTVDVPQGGYLTQRYVPLQRVGLCVPGGAAAYPSTVLMTALPARAAGVHELAVIAPPTDFGSYNENLLATCHELGIREVYRVGGAQGVAALAYGVEGMPPVDKIVGPGNLFVALAKKLVYGDVAIDSIAGPSEVIVIADESTNPAFAASDLIAQAEHAPGSSVLITWHQPLLDQVEDELNKQLAGLQRGELARQSLQSYGALLRVQDPDEAVEIANQLATEHLHLACQDAEKLLPMIRHAGAIFIGPYSPVAIGDYVAGPSHVLPTGATARFASGLCSNDFLRSGSVIHFDKASFKEVAEDAIHMANEEGLTGHANSVSMRLKELREKQE